MAHCIEFISVQSQITQQPSIHTDMSAGARLAMPWTVDRFEFYTSSPKTVCREGGQKADKCSGIALLIAEYKGFAHNKRRSAKPLLNIIEWDGFCCLTFVGRHSANPISTHPPGSSIFL